MLAKRDLALWLQQVDSLGYFRGYAYAPLLALCTILQRKRRFGRKRGSQKIASRKHYVKTIEEQRKRALEYYYGHREEQLAKKRTPEARKRAMEYYWAHREEINYRRKLKRCGCTE